MQLPPCKDEAVDFGFKELEEVLLPQSDGNISDISYHSANSIDGSKNSGRDKELEPLVYTGTELDDSLTPLIHHSTHTAASQPLSTVPRVSDDGIGMGALGGKFLIETKFADHIHI